MSQTLLIDLVLSISKKLLKYVIKRLVIDEYISFFVEIVGNQHKTRGRKTFGFDYVSHGHKGIHNNVLHFLQISI